MVSALMKVHDGKPQLAVSLCEAIIKSSQTSLNNHQTFTIALSGGSVPSLLSAKNMQTAFKTLNIPENYQGWHVFLADERVVFGRDEECNMRGLRELSFLGSRAAGKCVCYAIDDRDVQILLSSPSPVPALEQISLKYSHALSAALSTSDGRLDCAVLGMGEDGHTCSLFPYMDLTVPPQAQSSSQMPSQASTLSKVGYTTQSPKYPPIRISVTLDVLNTAKTVIFAAAGAEKKEVLEKIFERNGEVDGFGYASVNCKESYETPYPCAKVVPQRTNEDAVLIWLVDKDAASEIKAVGAKKLPEPVSI